MCVYICDCVGEKCNYNHYYLYYYTLELFYFVYLIEIFGDLSLSSTFHAAHRDVEMSCRHNDEKQCAYIQTVKNTYLHTPEKAHRENLYNFF